MGWFFNGKALLRLMIWVENPPFKETPIYKDGNVQYMDITPVTQDALVANEGFYFNVEILEP